MVRFGKLSSSVLRWSGLRWSIPATAFTWPFSLNKMTGCCTKPCSRAAILSNPPPFRAAWLSLALQLGRSLRDISGAVHDQANDRSLYMRERNAAGKLEQDQVIVACRCHSAGFAHVAQDRHRRDTRILQAADDAVKAHLGVKPA